MGKWITLLTLLLLSVGSRPAAADSEAVEALTAQLAQQGLSLSTLDTWYRQQVSAGVPIAALQQQLHEATAQQPSARAATGLASAVIHWQQGQREQAQQRVEQALAIQASATGYYLAAQLAEANGYSQQAQSAYQRALTLSQKREQQQSIRQRLALLQDTSEALRAVPAKQQQWQAEVLALTGHPALAIQLSEDAPTAAVARWLQHAEWALAADRAESAKNNAWRAFQAADSSVDKRYALALFSEAYRLHDELAEAYEFLRQQPRQDDLEQLQVDILLELQRYAEATEVVQQASAPALRQQLLGILEIAGDEPAMIAEYQRLIEAYPQQPQWSIGLADLYLNRGQQDAAVAVYQQLITRNSSNSEVIITAARQLVAVSLDQEALTMVQDSGDQQAIIALHFALLERYLNAQQQQPAEAQLALLDGLLASDSERRFDLADGYQRIGLLDHALTVLQDLQAQRRFNYDQQLYLANLAAQAGHYSLAMDSWRQLWLRERLPARKNYLSQRLIQQAKQQQQLPQLIQQQQQRVAQQPDDQQLTLLVDMYLAADDAVAAEQAVRQFSQSQQHSEAQLLQRLAPLYLRMQAFQRYEQTLQRLMTLQADAASDYWRQLALSRIHHSSTAQTEEQREAALTALIESYPASAEQAIDEAFVANLYLMAGSSAKAERYYNNMTARSADNLEQQQQWLALLKQRGEFARAITALQYAVISSDKAEQRYAALDGLLGLAAAASDAEYAGNRAQLLRWSKRQLFGQILRQGSDAYGLSLLSDVAQQLGDYGLVFRAQEMLVIDAGEQRGMQLRQLITLASEQQQNGDVQTSRLGDLTKKVRYGRRLIALKQAFPAEVYADIGRALLTADDAPGAERAFALMGGIQGLVDVDRIKGDAYAGAGYTNKALASYSRSLLRHQDDLKLLLQTAILHERQGHPELARRWYQQGLELLVQQQPVTGEQLAGAQTLSMFQYRSTLLEGLLLNWPRQPQQSHALLMRWQSLLTGAFESSQVLAPKAAYQQLSRLPQTLEIYQQIVPQVTNADVLEPWLARLQKRYPDSQALADSGQRYRRRHGLTQTADESDWPLQQLLLQADDQQHTALRFALALRLHDEQQIQALIADVIARFQHAADHSREALQTLLDVVADSTQELTPEHFQNWVYQPLQQLPQAEQLWFALLLQHPQAFSAATQHVAQPLLDDQRLRKRLLQAAADPALVAVVTRMSDVVDYLVERFDAAQLVSLYVSLQELSQAQGIQTSLTDSLLPRLFILPLSAASQRQLLDALHAELADGSLQTYRLARLLRSFLAPQLPQQNQPLVMQLATLLASEQPMLAGLTEFLSAFYQPSPQQAFQQLLALQQQTQQVAGVGEVWAALAQRYLAQPRAQYIEQFLAQQEVSDQQLQQFEQLILSMAQTDEQRLRYYGYLYQQRPQLNQYLLALLDLHWQQQAYQPFIKLLSDYIQQHGDDSDAKTVLFYAYQVAQQPALAAQLAERSHIDFFAESWLKQQFNNVAALKGQQRSFIALFAQVFARFSIDYPQHQAVAYVQQLMDVQSSAAPYAESPQMRELASLMQTSGWPDPAQPSLGFWRQLWRDSAQASLSRQILLSNQYDLEGAALAQYGLADVGQLVDLFKPEHAPAKAELLTTLSSIDAGSSELLLDLKMTDVTFRSGVQNLYQRIALGLTAQQHDQATREQLQQHLLAGDIDAHQMQLLASLMVNQPQPLSAELTAAWRQTLRRFPYQGAEQRILYAQVLGQGEAYADASALLQAALLQLLYPDLQQQRYRLPRAGQASALAMVEALATWPDSAAAATTFRQLYQIIAEHYQNPLAQALLAQLKLYAAEQIGVQSLEPLSPSNALNSELPSQGEALIVAALVRARAALLNDDPAATLDHWANAIAAANKLSQRAERQGFQALNGNAMQLQEVLFGGVQRLSFGDPLKVLNGTFAQLFLTRNNALSQATWQHLASSLAAESAPAQPTQAYIAVWLAAGFAQFGDEHQREHWQQRALAQFKQQSAFFSDDVKQQFNAVNAQTLSR